MNKEACKHLDLAADYIAKGDEFYRKAKLSRVEVWK